MLKKLHSTGNGLAKWKVWVRVHGKPVHRHFEATPEAAHQIHADLMNQAARARVGLQTYAPAAGKLLGESIDAYSRAILAEGQNAEHVQAVGRTLDFFRFKVSGPFVPLDRIGRTDVLRWRELRAVTPAKSPSGRAIKAPGPRTLNKELAHLSAFFSFCQMNGWLDANPAAKVPKIKTPEKPPKAMRWEDFNRFVAWFWERHPAAGLVLEVIAETGARVGEVIGATAGDVDAERGIWTGVKKGRRTVQLAAGPWTLAAAKIAKNPAAPLCPNKAGKHWNAGTLRGYFDRAAKALGLGKVHPHMLRHSRATWDVEAGMPARVIQERLGHRTLQTTEGYFRGAKAAQNAKDYAARGRPVPPDLVLQLCSRPVANTRLDEQGSAQLRKLATASKRHKSKQDKGVKAQTKQP